MFCSAIWNLGSHATSSPVANLSLEIYCTQHLLYGTQLNVFNYAAFRQFDFAGQRQKQKRKWTTPVSNWCFVRVKTNIPKTWLFYPIFNRISDPVIGMPNMLVQTLFKTHQPLGTRLRCEVVWNNWNRIVILKMYPTTNGKNKWFWKSTICSVDYRFRWGPDRRTRHSDRKRFIASRRDVFSAQQWESQVEQRIPG